MITLTVLAFIFVIGILAIVLAIAAEGMIIFPIIDIAVAVGIIAVFVKVLSRK